MLEASFVGLECLPKNCKQTSGITNTPRSSVHSVLALSNDDTLHLVQMLHKFKNRSSWLSTQAACDLVHA